MTIKSLAKLPPHFSVHKTSGEACREPRDLDLSKAICRNTCELLSPAVMVDKEEGNTPTVPKFSSFKPKSLKPLKPEDDEAGKSLVPKFGSFRVKDASSSGRDERRHRDERHHGGHGDERHRRTDDHERYRGRHDDGRHHDSKRRRNEERDRESLDSKRRRHGDRHRHEGGKRRDPSPLEKAHRPSKPPTLNPKDVKSDLFFFDTKGDPLISKYGGIEKSKMQRYRRYGGGRVLGTEGRLFVHRDGARDEFSLRMPGDWAGSSNDGLRVKRSYLKREGVQIKARKAKGGEEQEEDPGFLQVGKPGDHQADSAESSEEDEQPDYRSIAGKAKPTKVVDSESSDELPSDDEIPLHQSNPLRWRSMQLSRRVKEHPEDVDAWIELADHQDALLMAGVSADREVVEDELHSFTEIKTSMLERALQHTKKESDRRRVLRYLMREGPKVWSSKTTAKKWEELREHTREDFFLWRTYLDFEMSNIALASYDSIKGVLEGRMHAIMARADPFEQTADNLCEMTYIFLRWTRFSHDAGYKELAVASWQALLEFTFFRPVLSGGRDIDAVRLELKRFWDSEVARIGEADAKGWGHFFQTVPAGATADPPEPRQAEEQPEEATRSYRSWAQRESCEASQSCLPSRMMDEGNDEDVFRVVMFADLEPFLFFIPDGMLKSLGGMLLDAFFIFCGLPPTDQANSWIDAAWHDAFLARIRHGAPAGKSAMSQEDDQDGTTRRPLAFKGLEPHVQWEANLAFPNDSWFDMLDHSRPLAGLDMTWVGNVLRQTVLSACFEGRSSGFEALAPHTLAICALDPATSVKKTAKALMTKFWSNQDLYEAYAWAEFSRGNAGSAAKVLNSGLTLLAQSLGPDDESGPVLLQLGLTWAWMDLQTNGKSLALKRLCSAFNEDLRNAPDTTEVTSTHMLIARKQLSSDLPDSPRPMATRHKASMLLEYLLDGEPCDEPRSLDQGNICTAMDQVDRMSSSYNIHGEGAKVFLEEVLQFAARLLYFHTTKGPFRREYVRRNLVKFLDSFPRNTLLLSLLEWADSSLRVIDDTRAFLYDKILTGPNDCPTSRSFAIHHELVHGNVHTGRTAFENAVASDACKSNPGVWISYIRFCHEHRELSNKVKDVFHRALSHCPWSKQVMMEAFGTLVDIMDESELRGVYRTMEEKGMRIHVDLEQYLKG